METRVLIRSSPKPNAINPPPQWCSRWNLIMISLLVLEIFMFESVDAPMTARVPYYKLPQSLRLRWANKLATIPAKLSKPHAICRSSWRFKEAFSHIVRRQVPKSHVLGHQPICFIKILMWKTHFRSLKNLKITWCSKFVNTCLFISNKIWWIHKMLVSYVVWLTGKSGQIRLLLKKFRSSLIWVCDVCLGLLAGNKHSNFGRKYISILNFRTFIIDTLLSSTQGILKMRQGSTRWLFLILWNKTEILVLVPYLKSHSLNLHAQLSSRGRSLNFGLNLHLCQFFELTELFWTSRMHSHCIIVQ